MDNWAYSTDEELYFGNFETEGEARAAATIELDDNCECVELKNGDVGYYWIGQNCHPLDKMTEVEVGNIILESIDNRVYDIVQWDEPILDFSKSDVEELGKLALTFMRERAKVQVYALKNITKHEYIIGSNE